MSTHPTVQLGEVCRPRQWTTLSKKDLVTDGFPVYGANGKIGFATEFTHAKSTLLIGCRGSCGSVHITEPFSYANGNAMALDDLNEEWIEIKYPYHYFLHRGFRDVITGTSQPQIIQQHLRQVEILLPPLEEQRRIAAILDKAHEIQVADRKRRETLGRFQASYFRYLFGEPSKATENWSLKTIASCCKSIQTGPFGSLLHQSDYIQGGIPILNPKHIVNGVVSCGENETITGDKAEELSGYRLIEGDVLLARRGEMGRCAAITRRENGYLCGTGSMFLRPLRDALAPEYLAVLLSSENMRSMLERVAIGTTLLNFNSTIVGGVLIPVPPIELQFKYARFLARLDAIGDSTSRSAFACSDVLASVQNTIFPIVGS